MIPKIIHYCWLSDEPLPKDVCAYIDEWKRIMPDYKIKKWDKKTFDIHSSKWVEQAYENKKWAFAADYIRAYALYMEGGFYLDSDVLVNKRFDKFLNNGFVSSVEYNPSFEASIQKSIKFDYSRQEDYKYVEGLAVQAAIIGSVKGHSFLKEILNYYDSRKFIDKEGVMNLLPAPYIYSRMLESYGFRYKNEEQHLSNDILILKADVFAGFQTCTFSSVAIHMCVGSWTGKKQSIITIIKKNIFLRKLLNLIKFILRKNS